MGRFLNADALVSTGQGILGNNMFAYCGNNPVSRIDSTGSSFSSVFSVTCIDPGMGAQYDYVVYYFHPESSQNLDRVAINNHYVSDTIFYSVGTFDELVAAINSVPGYVDDVFIYMHSDESNLSFYYAQYYSAEDIESSFNEVDIAGNIYLFSCKGGRGELASTMAKATDCTVIASVYKVSFGTGFARCGWRNYWEDHSTEGDYAWYSFSPVGGKEPYSQYYVYTR